MGSKLSEFENETAPVRSENQCSIHKDMMRLKSRFTAKQISI